MTYIARRQRHGLSREERKAQRMHEALVTKLNDTAWRKGEAPLGYPHAHGREQRK